MAHVHVRSECWVQLLTAHRSIIILRSFSPRLPATANATPAHAPSARHVWAATRSAASTATTVLPQPWPPYAPPQNVPPQVKDLGIDSTHQVGCAPRYLQPTILGIDSSVSM